VWSLPAPPDAARDPAVVARLGDLVARGADLSIERVALTDSITVDVAGKSVDVAFVYRVTVSAGPYLMRDMPAVLSVGSTALGVAAESSDLAQLVLYTHDPAVLVDGATIGLTYGAPGDVPADWSTTIEVLP